jgi:hypothetical protein
MSKLSKQDIVVQMVQEGIHTRQEIKDGADCTPGALASYLSGMRNAAKFTGAKVCPIEITLEDGKKVYTVMTFQEVEEAKAARTTTTSSATSKSPAERLDAAIKRATKCEVAVDKATERYEANDDNLELELRMQKAQIEAQLADIEVARSQAIVDASGVEEIDDDVETEELM